MFEELIPELRDFGLQLLDVAARAGVGLTVTSTLRTHSVQARLYRKFLRGETKYPVAPPGSSAHEYGYAFDAVSQPREYQADFGQVWRDWGGVWSPKDDVHFEYPGFRAPGLSEAEQPSGGKQAPSLWDYGSTALSMTGLWSLLLELGFVVASEEEAERIARVLHIDPHGHIF